MAPNRRAFMGAVGGLLAAGAFSAPASGELTVTADPDVVTALEAMGVDPDRPVADRIREADSGFDAPVAELVRPDRPTGQ